MRQLFFEIKPNNKGEIWLIFELQNYHISFCFCFCSSDDFLLSLLLSLRSLRSLTQPSFEIWLLVPAEKVRLGNAKAVVLPTAGFPFTHPPIPTHSLTHPSQRGQVRKRSAQAQRQQVCQMRAPTKSNSRTYC